ncbi:hypothetical protein AZH53_01250 [Methanomicrobiaceae archaeon CYW5]|uniref:hypothetical protein n=1 Tax=Methanovulcanius yangii TaxID=1789227 RepID=UPI0029CA2C84|nr:hypothetical protein [Methanovulcanius yangii]MBT8507055.1 hypothetical protein [Methanovulcanius yangii]
MKYYSPIAILIILFSLIASASSNPNLIYNKNEKPVFQYDDIPIIVSQQGSYQIGENTYGGDILNHTDENIEFEYLLYGITVTDENTTFSIGTPERNDGNFPDLSEEKTTISNFDQDKIQNTSSINTYKTRTDGINSFLTQKIGKQANFKVKYKIKNENINHVSPFIFELGKWPIFVGENKIEDTLDLIISENFLYIYGEGIAVVFNKNTDEFYYIFREINESYYLIIQRKTIGKEEKSLEIYFRPVFVKADIKIDDIYPGKISENLKVLPEITVSLNETQISKIQFKYYSADEQINSTKDISANSKIDFKEWIIPKSNGFYYPFESYSTEIEVYPPLLIPEEKAIETPYKSELDGTAKISSDKIEIILKRTNKEIFSYFGWLLLIFFLPLFFAYFCNEYTKIFFLISIFSFVYFFFKENLSHFLSIGSMISLTLLITSLIMFMKYTGILK